MNEREEAEIATCGEDTLKQVCTTLGAKIYENEHKKTKLNKEDYPDI